MVVTTTLNNKMIDLARTSVEPAYKPYLSRQPQDYGLLGPVSLVPVGRAQARLTGTTGAATAQPSVAGGVTPAQALPATGGVSALPALIALGAAAAVARRRRRFA